jgi:hypothetical protein
MKEELEHLLHELYVLQNSIKDILIFLYKMIAGWNK